jgi:hypothetical protein
VPDVAEGLLQLGLHPELAGQTLHLSTSHA